MSWRRVSRRLRSMPATVSAPGGGGVRPGADRPRYDATPARSQTLLRCAHPPASGNLAGVIEVNELTKRYRDTVAVDRLSFAVKPGMVTGFLGPNGAGKTTTMRALLGLVAPTSGEALVNGRRY